MPAKSSRQYKLMAAIAHGASPSSKTGPSKEVAKKFVEETPAAKRSMFMKKKKKHG